MKEPDPSPQITAAAVREARMIVSRHDGIHQLHSDCAALELIAGCINRGVPVEIAEVERILERMRRADVTGIWSQK